MPIEKLTIGHLARETGTKVATVRYYEKIGLMPGSLPLGRQPTALRL